jgi:hypothetical protein
MDTWPGTRLLTACPPIRQNEVTIMLIRELIVALLLSLALSSLPGSAQAQGGPLAFCKADAARLCPGVKPGGGKLLGCLKQRENEVSVGCAKELKAVKTKMGK